jgi:hypothetical protein
MRKVISPCLMMVVFAGTLLLACGDEEENPTPTPLVNDSPANCLKIVAASWRDKDYGRFKPCLSPDCVFYFNPDDVGQVVEGYTIPESWNRAEMLAAIQNMLDEAYTLDISIPTATVGKPGSGATTWRAHDVVITMTLMIEPVTGYRIGAGYCNFAFEKYEENNEARWRLTAWWDFTSESRAAAAVPGIAPASLGRMLAVSY